MAWAQQIGVCLLNADIEPFFEGLKAPYAGMAYGSLEERAHETPVFAGGYTVRNFKPVTDPAALARLPPAARVHVRASPLAGASCPGTDRHPDGRGGENGLGPIL